MKSFCSRRNFMAGSLALAPSVRAFEGAIVERFRIAVIGHTGRGDYGHGLDTMWQGIPQADLVAVADADPKGLETARKKLKIDRGYLDYQRMLLDAKPDVVAIGMRHVDQHYDVAMAAIEAGVRGIYIEKPFCRSPGEADAIVHAAAKRSVKIAVAHRNRYHPVLPVIAQLVKDGVIGRVLEYRMRGKEDARGGMQDMWVLGTHLVNLVHYFAGEPRSCSAAVLVNGRVATTADAKPGAEGLDLYAGDEVHARFEMSNGVTAYLDSIVNAGNKKAGFGIQMIGSEGIIDFRIDQEPLAHLRQGNPFLPSKERQSWIPISTSGVGIVEPMADVGTQVSRHWLPGNDLLAAIVEDRDPLCSGLDGALTVEMITAISASHLKQGGRVAFPLAVRTNPWTA